jgi:hypothetical protein
MGTASCRHGSESSKNGNILTDDLEHPHAVNDCGTGHTDVHEACQDLIEKFFLVEDKNEQMH